MLNINDNKQNPLFDPWQYLSPKRRTMLEEGWPGLFRRQILCHLPIERLTPFYCVKTGRPSKELYTVMGALLLQQVMDLTDEQTVEQLAFNIQWHFALNITEESDSAKYICTKTLWLVRQLMMICNTDTLIFKLITGKMATAFKVNTDCQRIDSTHIRSNMRRLGRVSLFSQTMHKFLVNLKRHHPGLMESIDEDVQARYLKKKSLCAFALVKPSAADKTLEQLSADLFNLVGQFKDREAVMAMTSYKQMVRLLHEHCNLDDDSSRPVTVKPAKEIACDSLQNPSDPDATYSGHKGQGYQVQIMETYSPADDDKPGESTPNLITCVSVQPACQADSHALLPAIEESLQDDLVPAKLLADTAYGSDANVEQAAEIGVELVAPAAKGGPARQADLSGFEFDPTGRITRCPQGHRPHSVKHKKKRDRFSACFDLQQCRQCPLKEQCLCTPGKKHGYVRYGRKDYRLALRRKAEHSDEFVDTYRWRAGVEATMSAYKRVTGAGRLRVRGAKAVRYCATLKAAGINLLRCAAAHRARCRARRANSGLTGTRGSIWGFFKEQLGRFKPKSSTVLLPIGPGKFWGLKLAA